jgi:hypothetical protein
VSASLSLAELLVAAVGDEGRIALHDADGWSEPATGASSDLGAVDLVEDGYLLAVGANGAFVHGHGQDLRACELGPFDMAGIAEERVYMGDVAFMAVAADGRTIHLSPSFLGYPICFESPAPVPALGFGFFPCGISDNPIVVAADGLYGGYGCAID